MKVYLAAKYDRMLELRAYRAELQELGHTVTSSWLDDDPKGADESDPSNAHLAAAAKQDLADIEEADCLILFTGGAQSPGRNTEFGFALGLPGMDLVIVGPRESVFHHLPSRTSVYANWSELLERF